MKRRRTAQEQKLADDARLLRWWKAWHREQREAVLAGPHGAVLGELFRMFKNLEHVQPVQLIGSARAIDWTAIDFDTRLTVLHEANASISKYREKCGLDPINDALPGEPDTPFRALKAIMFPSSPHHEGVHRDAARPEKTVTAA
jgi:hypothetical protein